MPVKKRTGKAPGKRARKDAATPGGSGSDDTPLRDGDPRKTPFNPETLDRTVIAIPLLRQLEEEKREQNKGVQRPPKIYSIIIDLNLMYPGGKNQAMQYVRKKMEQALKVSKADAAAQGLRNKMGTADDGTVESNMLVEQYLFARLDGEAIRWLVNEDGRKDDKVKTALLEKNQFSRAIYHIWPDFQIRRLTTKSVSTVKADAARASFSAFGEGIVWAVLDSGIDRNHRHFTLHDNLELQRPLVHIDFTGGKNTGSDPRGHGTHVAGIIAGEMNLHARLSEHPAAKKPQRKPKNDRVLAAVRNRNENDETEYSSVELTAISGIAPKCKLVNMRVLDDDGYGEVSSIIAAIAKIQELNSHGRNLLIHGVNLSVGNDFEPEWFACGQSPLCVEVNRLVKSGVAVVVAAGNSGYGSLATKFTDTINTGLSLTINDPGNADLAITVGSTHRDMPHTYGVSYFSSKGPTGDGRLKPDLVAPGEKIISCATGKTRDEVEAEVGEKYEYAEDSGTSMAAPHVSGAIAAFLSVRREFIGQPEKVKQIFLTTATDLKRERYFQGSGLIDLMRAIQSV
jgi:serine protease AprX